MNQQDFLAYKIPILIKEGYSKPQAIAISFSLFQKEGKKMQEGGEFNYNKTGDLNIGQRDLARINEGTGINFTPQFSQNYFSTQSTPPPAQKQAVDYSTYPIVDITSDGQFTNRKVWRTQRPEWFVGKQEPVEGKDYTTVPYSQWKTYQNSPEYSTYTNRGQIVSMQQGGNIKEGNEWLKNWYQNREIPNEYVQGAYLEDKPIYSERLKNIPDTTKVDNIGNNPNITGRYDSEKNKMFLTPNAQPSVYLHELNHYANSFPSTMRTIHKDIIDRNIYKKGDKRLQNNNEIYDYLKDPDEIHSRIQVLRKNAGFKPNESVTKEKLLNYLQNYRGNDENILQIINMSDEKGLLEMLNYMAEVPQNKKTQYLAQQGGMFSGYRMDVPNNIGYTQQNINPSQAYQPTDYSGNFMQNNPLPSYSYNGLQVNPNTVNQSFSNATPQTNPLSANVGSGYQTDENGNPIQPQFSNIFAGGDNISLGLRTLGAGIGEKDATKIGMGAGLTAISGARNFLGGLSTGRENRRVEEEYRNDLFRDNRTVQMLQEGGSTGVKNSEILTGKFAIDEGQGTVNIERGEFLKDNQSGNIQEAIGENHKNGGININAQDAKVLSNYTKIGAKNAKELKDRYNISIKKTDTFAKVMDKVNKKIGVDEAIEEQAKAIEDLGKNEVVKDATTKRLNETTLVKEVQEYEQKLESLKGAQNFIFEDIFAMQEKIAKKGNGELLDAKGKPMEVNETPALQQGGHIGELANKYGISPQRAEELIKMQEGGQIQTEQEEQVEGQEPSPEQVIMAFAEATQQDPNVIAQQLQQLSPEEQQQALIQMVQQLQAPQNEAPQEEMMQEGGEKNTYLQNSTLLNNFTNPPAQLSNLPYTPRETNPNEIWKGENYASFWKPLVEKSMSNPEQAKKIDEWLMSNKDSFAPNIKNQLEGLTGEKRLNRIKQLATDEKPGLFHNALLEAIKVTSPPQEVAKIEAVTATPEFNYGATEEGQTPTVVPDNTSGFQPYITPPSPRQGVILETAQAPNYERIKRTFEPSQAALANQLDTRRQQLIASGLSPMAQEALMANESANAQSSANQNIASVEQFNAQNQQQVNAMQENANFKNDLFNINQRDEFFLRNTAARDNQDLAQKQYNDAYNRLGYKTQEDAKNLATVNAMYSDMRINRDGSVTVIPKTETITPDNTAYNEWYDKQTPQVQEQERIRLTQGKLDAINAQKKLKALKK